jgi:hypothetical protein
VGRAELARSQQQQDATATDLEISASAMTPRLPPRDNGTSSSADNSRSGINATAGGIACRISHRGIRPWPEMLFDLLEEAE